MRWIPLEINPEVMNAYLVELGVPEKWKFVDMWGLDAELLAFIPKPVRAVILLYPVSPEIDANPIGNEPEDPQSSELFFMKQTIGNACGTMAIIHSVANTAQQLGVQPNSYMSRLLAKMSAVSHEERSEVLETDSELEQIHSSSAVSGQTEAPEASTNTNLHFCAFVEFKGALYELDGRKSGPVRHGECGPDQLLECSAELVRRFIARDPTSTNFSMIALHRDPEVPE